MYFIFQSCNIQKVFPYFSRSSRTHYIYNTYDWASWLISTFSPLSLSLTPSLASSSSFRRGYRWWSLWLRLEAYGGFLALVISLVLSLPSFYRADSLFRSVGFAACPLVHSVGSLSLSCSSSIFFSSGSIRNQVNQFNR